METHEAPALNPKRGRVTAGQGTTASRHGRRWPRRLALVSLLAALGTCGFSLERWWARGELQRVEQEIARRDWASARQRLSGIARLRFLHRDGEIDYWLGICEWRSGRLDEALECLERVPAGSEHEVLAAVWQAEILMMRSQFRAAEDRLLRVMRPGQRGLNPARDRLERLGLMEGRYDEVRAWLRDGFAEAEDPVGVLRQLWVVDRGVAPTGVSREYLERALAQSPDDDRIWLGLARLDLGEGRLDEAAGRLRRCLARAPVDRAVARAWLDWADAAGRADELSRILAGPLWTDLDASERLAWRARLARLVGDEGDERRIVESWLNAEPRNPAALERMSELLARAGDTARRTEIRGRKAQVDEALDLYHRRIKAGQFAGADDRLAMARLSEQAGRPFDALAWATLAIRTSPGDPEAVNTLARLERQRALVEASGAASEGPWRRQPQLGKPRGERPADAAQVEFRDDAEAASLRFTFLNGETAIRQLPVTMGGGVGLLDHDRDGRLDVYCVQGGAFPPDSSAPVQGDRLFRNRGDGTFEDVTARAGIAKLAGGYGHGVAVGDYDGDGHPDLFITRWRAYALYRNKGDGTFQDATQSAGLGGDRDWPTSAAFADLDGDGDLDLYVCHYLRWDAENPKVCRDASSHAYATCIPRDFAALPDHLFRNDGGRFVDVTTAAGITDEDGRGLGVVASDLDGDGRVDLFVANDQSANYLFRNLGDFRFEEVGHVAGLATSASGGYKSGMGIACGDVDNDGRPDLAVTNFFAESTTLYENLGGGLFSDWTAASGLGAASRSLLGFGASFLDADNDGRLDLMTANGHLDHIPGTPFQMPVQFLKGDGGRLRDATAAAGPALLVPRIGRALAVGDLDNDGRVDALVLSHNGPLAYLHNQSPRIGHFVAIGLEGAGAGSNRDAVGAHVEVIAAGRHHHGWRIGGGSYQSASDGRLHFGLGPADHIEDIIVTWPSGKVQRFEDLRANRGYRLHESQDAPGLLPGFAAE